MKIRKVLQDWFRAEPEPDCTGFAESDREGFALVFQAMRERRRFASLNGIGCYPTDGEMIVFSPRMGCIIEGVSFSDVETFIATAERQLTALDSK